MLAEGGVESIVCKTLGELCTQLEQPCGAIVLAEEGLSFPNAERIIGCLEEQPAWSSIPIILVARRIGQESDHLRLLESFGVAGNLTVLERPFRKVTLVTAVRGALRARKRQYELRDNLTRETELRQALQRRMEQLSASERTIAENRKLLQTLVDAVPSLISLVGSDLVYRMVNNSYAEWFGTPKEQIIGQPISAVVGPEAYATIKPYLERALGGEVVHFDAKLAYPTGSRAVSGTYVPNRNETGELDGLIVYIHDVSERNQITEALRERERSLEFVLKAGQLGAWELSPASGSFQCNEQCRRDLGMPNGAELNYDQLLGVMNEEDREHFRAAIKNALASDRELALDCRVAPAGGMARWISFRGRLDRNEQNSNRIAGITADITERKVSETLIRKQSERAQILYEAFAHLLLARDTRSMLEGVFAKVAAHLECDRYLCYLSDEEKRVLRIHASGGFNGEELGSLQQIAHGEAVCGAVALSKEPLAAMRVQESKGEQTALIKRLGIRAYSCSPLLIEERLIGTLSFGSTRRDHFKEDELQFLRLMAQYVSVAIDRLRNEEQLQRAKSGLEDLVAQRTARLTETITDLEAFSYSITHDMRAPLRSMQNFAMILDEELGGSLAPEHKNYLGRIMSSAARLDKLIRDVLAFSRVLQSELELEQIDADRLIREIVGSYPDFQPPKARIEIAGPIPMVLANEAALTQCISNLLGNAIKFVKPGTQPEIEIRAEKRDGRVRISFRDNGIGIAPEHRERIFHLFQRVDRKVEGTGIGLSIVRKTVGRMGGEVSVSSEPGRGSVFTLELRCAEEAGE